MKSIKYLILFALFLTLCKADDHNCTMTRTNKTSGGKGLETLSDWQYKENDKNFEVCNDFYTACFVYEKGKSGAKVTVWDADDKGENCDMSKCVAHPDAGKPDSGVPAGAVLCTCSGHCEAYWVGILVTVLLAAALIAYLAWEGGGNPGTGLMKVLSCNCCGMK